MSLPAQARHRWHLDAGGDVAWLDLGEMVVLLPGTVADVRALLLDRLTGEDWAGAREGFGDPDLCNQ
jgi:hypothetical protein